MQIHQVGGYQEMSRVAAELVADVLTADPTATVIPATGATPMGLYQDLGRRVAAGTLDASRIRVFQLDEYLDVPSEDPRSLYAWMERSVLRPLGVSSDAVTRLQGTARDLAAACRHYDAALVDAGGADLAILGLGLNGHLGYNEPPSSRDAPTREVTLTTSSLESASDYFGGVGVPSRALTAGMVHLLAARRILLLASGEKKRSILQRSLFGTVGPEVPASWLQTVPHVHVIADAAALGSPP